MNKDKFFGIVAKSELGIDNLATRNSDALDFHDVSVWQVRAAFKKVWRGRDGEVRRLRKRIAALKASGCRKPPVGRTVGRVA